MLCPPEGPIILGFLDGWVVMLWSSVVLDCFGWLWLVRAVARGIKLRGGGVQALNLPTGGHGF